MMEVVIDEGDDDGVGMLVGNGTDYDWNNNRIKYTKR